MEPASSQISRQVCSLSGVPKSFGLMGIKFNIHFTCYSKCDFPNNGVYLYNVISLEKNSEFHKNVNIESVTMFSFQQYHLHFGALNEIENIIFFVDRTRLLSISIYMASAC